MDDVPVCSDCVQAGRYTGFIIDRTVTDMTVCDPTGKPVAKVGPERFRVRYFCMTCTCLLRNEEPNDHSRSKTGDQAGAGDSNRDVKSSGEPNP